MNRTNRYCAVLVGHNFTTILGFMRSLGRAGYDVYVIRTGVPGGRNPIRRIGSMPEKHSKYLTQYFRVASKDENAILDILLKIIPGYEKRIVIPVDDICTELLDRHYNALKQQQYILPNCNGQQGGIVRIMNKMLQKDLAQKCGLPVAKGWSIEIKNGNYEIPKEIVYPCFVKAEVPLRARKLIMTKCANYDELNATMQKAAGIGNFPVIVEEFIPIDQEYCIVGFSDGSRVFIPDFIEETVLGHGEHAGVTCFGKVMGASSFASFIEPLRAFIASLNYHGFFTVDVLQSRAKYYFCEINMRIGGSGCSVIGAGVNLPVIYAEQFTEEKENLPDSECRNITFASERPLVNDLITGQLDHKQYKKYLKQADYRFVYDAEDKGPYLNYFLYILNQFARMKVKKRQRR